MIANAIDNLKPMRDNSVGEPRVWVDLRHPVTRRFIGKYCPQTNQFEVTDRGKRAVIVLPKD